MKPRNDTRQRDIARHHATHHHPAHRKPEEPSLWDVIESQFAIMIAFVLGGGFALLIVAQVWHAWGWSGVTGALALVALIALAWKDRR